MSFDLDKLNRYRSAPALFFVDKGVIAHTQTPSALLPLEATIQHLSLDIETALYCHPALVLQTRLTIDEPLLREQGYQILPIRHYLTESTPEQQQLMLRAYHWLNWETISRFCGRCGAPLTSQIDRAEKQCAQCQHILFPRFSPAVMVLIENKGKILLARSKHFRTGVYSALAGFVEVGETAEMAAHREVKEEVGLDITDLEYFASQTWPFPDSFMIAFKARYAGGELTIDPNEIEDANWFSLNELPLLPSMPSISRLLIDSVVEALKR